MTKYLLIDGNSIAFAANSGTKLTVGATEVQGIYGVLRTMRAKMAVFGHHKPIILWDGASWRKLINSEYKANRDKDPKNIHEKRLMLTKDSLKKQAPYIRQGLSFLGISQVSALNMEADDLAGILVERYEKTAENIILLSGDRDWIQLIGPKTIWIDPIHDRKITLATMKEKYGVDTPSQFLEMKALMGDAGDNLPGVGGIGEKGAVEFLNTYGSFDNFFQQVSFGQIDIKSLPKKYRDLVEDEQKALNFSMNLKLMDLRTTARPDPINLVVNNGTPDIKKFREFCDLLLFRSITEQLENWVSVFPAFKHMEIAA